MLTPQRRYHKSKSDASSSSLDSTPMSSNHSTRSGLSSYFEHARRRWTKSHRENDTLLPTTYSSIPGGAHPSKRPSPAALTCNHFLMGGHYYPGKDKKRRQMRRRTLWYKLFCSSPLRQVSSGLLVLYILIWHVIIPTVDWVLQSSKVSHNAQYSNWLLFDSTLQIPDFDTDQRNSVKVAAARARLQYGSPQERWNLLELISPIWYHRNDPNTEMDKNDRLKDTTKTDEREKTPVEPKSEQVVVTPHEAPIDKLQEDHSETGKARILTMNGNDLIVRTIHTPPNEANRHSQCPPTDSIEYSTTLLTQTTKSRLWILDETCTRWKDPIIAVVFIPHGQEVTSPNVSSCSNLQIIHYQASVEESDGPYYPVNRLRNVGLDAVTTSHVLMMDVDFVPSMDLSDRIQKALQLRHEHHPQKEEKHEYQQALVVPAFERLPPTPCETDSECASFLQSNSSFIPRTFEELKHCVGNKDCIVFQSNNNWEGHWTTRSEHWLERQWYQDDEKTTFLTIPCFHTARYEPYVVLRWCQSGAPVAPYYDERFHGYGKNKIELVSHLRKQGYQFDILPEGFIVHNPHLESSIKETWNDRKGSELHSSMDKLYSTFLEELDTMYHDAHERSVKLCKNQKP